MIDIVWLSAIQGISEFLPISSSGHLFIAASLFSLKSLSRSTEVVLNFASLLVIFVYFRAEIQDLFVATLKAFTGKVSPKFHQGLKICVATLPVIGVGFLVHTYLDHLTHSYCLFGWGSIFFGTLMIVADRTGPLSKTYAQISYRDAVLIGCVQTFSFIPGSSRFGMSLTMSRILGYKPADAAKFSFLTSIPIGVGALVLLARDIFQDSFFQISFDFFIISTVCFVTGFATLYFFMWWLKKRTLLIWGVYRILLGLFVLYYFNAFLP
jgi:undecaprenyl-diphosphatase